MYDYVHTTLLTYGQFEAFNIRLPKRLHKCRHITIYNNTFNVCSVNYPQKLLYLTMASHSVGYTKSAWQFNDASKCEQGVLVINFCITKC